MDKKTASPRFLRDQLAILFGIAILAVAIASSLATSWLAVKEFHESLVQKGNHIALNLASLSRLSLLYESAENVKDVLNASLRFPNVDGVFVYTHTHRLIAQAGKQHNASAPSDMTVFGEDIAPFVREDDSHWEFFAPVYSRVRQADEGIALESAPPELLGYVKVAVSKANLKLLIKRIFLGNLAITIAIAAIFLALLHRLTTRLLDPLRSLATTMARAREGERSLRVVQQGPRDFTEMADAFNAMMGSLENREQDLRLAKESAETQASGKLRFLANISHEIRTPLHGVLGTLGLALRTQLTPQQRQYLEVATNSSDNLLALLDDLLDLSKAESGKLALERTPMDIWRCAEDAIALHAKTAQEKSIELVLLRNNIIPHQVLGDPTRLGQVFNNLISNAVKFTERGEVVVTLSIEQQAESTYLLTAEVMDSGIGIPESALVTIFDAFTQADPSTTRRFGGTGLGLTLTRQLIEVMGGTIHVTSEPDVGSCFRFTVPFGHTDTQTSTPKNIQQNEYLGKSALMIESHPLVRRSLRQHLEYMGMQIHEAADIPEALRKLQHADLNLDIVIASDKALQSASNDIAQTFAEHMTKPIVHLSPLKDTSHELEQRRNVIYKPIRLSQLTGVLEAALTPFREPAPTETKHIPSEGSTFSQFRILVVEDNEINQMVARGMLQQLGLQVELVNHGQEALHVCAQKRFDLIFMDCRMPIMDGYTATRELRKRESGTHHTPIIAMSANVTADEQQRAREAGMDSFVAKPFTSQDIRNVVSSWLAPQSTLAVNALKASLAANDDPVDTQALDDLREAVGGPIDRILNAFLTQMNGRINQVKHYCRIGDSKALAWVAHSFKGSCVNVGARRLAEICTTLELQGNQGQIASDELIHALEQEAKRVYEALNRELHYA